MKTLLTASCLALASASVFAADNAPLWLRGTAISPDAKQVAFTYKGDIYVVPTAGGTARRLTTSDAYDGDPVWSPSGRSIAFSSDRLGTADIFVVDAEGGTPRRITTDSRRETPATFLDENTLLFFTPGMAARWSSRGAFGFPMAYTVDISTPGARPQLYLSVPMRSANFAAGKGLLYADKKGYEDVLRKHERSAGTADVWLYADGNFKQLTDFNGHDQEPVWAPGADTFYYVSEKDGTLNVYSRDISSGAEKQLTHFTKHPVRNLSAAADGTLAFSWDGELYSLSPGNEPVKIPVTIATDDFDGDLVKGVRSSGASNIAPSPDGKEVALILRGELYVTDTKYKTTRRITDTSAQERCVDFAPDGKTLVYDSDRDGYWQLFTAKTGKDDSSFAYAEEIVETPLYKCATSAMQPLFSPDGKKVAFLENRTAIRVIDLDTKNVVTALDGKYNYSYSDGDVDFRWSPDSKWLLATYIGEGGWNNVDIALVKADGSEVIDLTESGFSDAMPRWTLDGGAMTYVTSRYGMKSQGSWGNTYDIVLMALNGEAWDNFNLTEEEAALKEKAEKDAEKDKEDKSDKKDKKKDKKASAKEKEVKPISFDLGDRRYRKARLTGQSAFISDYYLSPKADKLYYIASATEGKSNLYELDIRKGETKVLCAGLSGGMAPDAKGENLFVLSYTGISKVSLSDGKTESVEFSAFYDRKPSAEREYIYDHMLRQVHDKFYDADLHGVDWEYYGDHYRKFLPYINNNRDFANLLSEILGELNASHTGGRYRPSSSALRVASLGAYFDESYDGDGLKIAEVINRGPLSTRKAGISVGDVITEIDGSPILRGKEYYSLLEGKVGRNTMLKVRKADGTVKTVKIKPISEGTEEELLYQRWVERNEALVDSLSGGKIGYVHVEGMNSPSYRNAYERILGKYRNCDAIIVDTRYNGGGWLHNDLAVLLGGKEYVKFMPRGRYIGHEPFSQWTKPSVMLVNESNYSDAHGAPYTYQTLGIGDIVGAPIPGTMTAVWWETQIDPTLIFGIPQVTNASVQGKPLENQQLTPDVIIYNNPAEVEKGTDAQLEGAVRHLLRKIAAK